MIRPANPDGFCRSRDGNGKHRARQKQSRHSAVYYCVPGSFSPIATISGSPRAQGEFGLKRAPPPDHAILEKREPDGAARLVLENPVGHRRTANAAAGSMLIAQAAQPHAMNGR
jgi:hypothetical protein